MIFFGSGVLFLILMIDVSSETVSWEEPTETVQSLACESSNPLESNNPQVNRDIKEGHRMPRGSPVRGGIVHKIMYFQLL